MGLFCDQWGKVIPEEKEGKINLFVSTDQINATAAKQSSTRMKIPSCSSTGNPERKRENVGGRGILFLCDIFEGLTFMKQ